MNKAQLKALLENMKLNWADWEKADSPIGLFLEKLKIDDDYDEEQIRLIGMLLSKSVNTDKAQMFWEILDPACTGKSGKEAFEALFSKLIDLVGDKTYILVKGSNKKGEYDQVTDYCKNLTETANIAKTKLITSVFSSDEITKVVFMEKFRANQVEYGSMFSPKGLRAYLKKTYDETPANEKGSVAAVNDMFANFA